MRRGVVDAFAGCVGALLAVGIAAVACDDDPAANPATGIDASIESGTIAPAAPADSGAQAPQDGGTGSVPDAADAASPGSLLGVRVTFLGVEHVFGSQDESALQAFLARETGAPTARINPANLTATDLANVDTLVIGKLTRGYSADEASALAAWVASGKGVLVLSGFTGDFAATNSLLVPFDLTLLGSTGGSNAYVHEFAPHPLTKDLVNLLFYNGQTVAFGADAGPVVNYARYGGMNVGAVRTYGLGRIATYGDDWIVFNQEVNRTLTDAGVAPPEDGGYNAATPTKQFWHNVLLWAAGRE